MKSKQRQKERRKKETRVRKNWALTFSCFEKIDLLQKFVHFLYLVDVWKGVRNFKHFRFDSQHLFS